MISPWNVLARLKHYIEIDSDTEDSALSVCVVNLETIMSKIKDTADKDDPRITQAAAAMSYYDFAVRFASDGNDGITSFKAGDVTLSRSSQSLIEIASDVKKHALEDIAPLMRDEDFCFLAV